MIRRETYPDIMRKIAHSPEVEPFLMIADEAPDWETLAALQRLALTEGDDADLGVKVLSNGEDALAIFTETAPGIVQGHTAFANTCRGRRAVETGKEVIAFLFAHGVEVVWGCTPRDNRKARWFNRQIGMHPLPSSDDENEVFEIRKVAA